MEPVVVAMLFADQVIVEANTNKKTLVGTFNRFFSRKFPVRFPPWFIYVAFTQCGRRRPFLQLESRA